MLDRLVFALVIVGIPLTTFATVAGLFSVELAIGIVWAAVFVSFAGGLMKLRRKAD